MSKVLNRVLLDTHVWIWLVNGSNDLAQEMTRTIDAAARSGAVYIPAIAVWEAATIAAKGRVALRPSIHEWVSQALDQPGIELASLEPRIAIESVLLPEGFHGDPADRLIVATARVLSIPLLTRDGRILQYAEQGHLTAIAA